MPSPLPERIDYLAATLVDLEKFDPEDLGDDNPDAMDLVESALRGRLRGMSGAQAKRTVEEDGNVLAGWLAQPGLEVSTGHYVHGVLMGMLMFADFGDFIGE